MKELKKAGYQKTKRSGPTGIGKTLESLLDLKENNIQGPDFETYELKSKRRASNSMVTFVTRTPQPEGSINEMKEAYGYPWDGTPDEPVVSDDETLSKWVGLPEPESSRDPRIGKLVLHQTVSAVKPNALGFILRRSKGVWTVVNDKKIPCYYEDEYVFEALRDKYPDRLIVVEADHRGTNEEEEFWYNGSIKIYHNFRFDTFHELVAKGIILVDLRLGLYPNGKPHDHGTGFRAFPRNIDQCFEKVEVVREA